MSERMVKCAKLGRELAGLKEPPLSGELGHLIYENISEEAWQDWRDNVQIKVINEYRLNLGDKKDYQYLIEQMCLFLNLEYSCE